jgi:hypothetical protein
MSSKKQMHDNISNLNFKKKHNYMTHKVDILFLRYKCFKLKHKYRRCFNSTTNQIKINKEERPYKRYLTPW